MSIIEEAARRLQQIRQSESGNFPDMPPVQTPSANRAPPRRSQADLLEIAVARASETAPAIQPAVAPPPDVFFQEPIIPAATPTLTPESEAAAPSPAAVAPTLEEPAPTPSVTPDTQAHATHSSPASRHDRSKYVELNLAQLAAKGIITPDAPRSQLADEFRVIKRPLLLNAQGKGAVPVVNGNMIMVTSSVPGEGKTFSAINLAMSIAMEMDVSVLLVDSDVSRPSVLNVLGLPAARGLMDVLLDDKMDLSDVMLRTNIRKFSLLPVGSAAKRATELLASEAMNKLLIEMANRYSDRVIIFDSPPLLVTTEAPVLARHMGQIMMVVNSTSTSRALVKQALASISTCPVVMMMLNKVTSPGKGGYYDYYGYGGYGAYGANVPG